MLVRGDATNSPDRTTRSTVGPARERIERRRIVPPLWHARFGVRPTSWSPRIATRWSIQTTPCHGAKSPAAYGHATNRGTGSRDVLLSEKEKTLQKECVDHSINAR